MERLPLARSGAKLPGQGGGGQGGPRGGDTGRGPEEGSRERGTCSPRWGRCCPRWPSAPSRHILPRLAGWGGGSARDGGWMSPPAAGAGPAPSPRSLRDLPLKLRQSRRRRDGERAGEGGRRDGAAGGDKARAAGLGQTGRGAGAGVTPPGGQRHSPRPPLSPGTGPSAQPGAPPDPASRSSRPAPSGRRRCPGGNPARAGLWRSRPPGQA